MSQDGETSLHPGPRHLPLLCAVAADGSQRPPDEREAGAAHSLHVVVHATNGGHLRFGSAAVLPRFHSPPPECHGAGSPVATRAGHAKSNCISAWSRVSLLGPTRILSKRRWCTAAQRKMNVRNGLQIPPLHRQLAGEKPRSLLGLQPRHFGQEKAREVSWQGSPRRWGGATTCERDTIVPEGGISTPRIVEEFQPRISKKEKKNSGRHFGWPFWPTQAGLGRPPRPGGEEAAAGPELRGVPLPRQW